MLVSMWMSKTLVTAPPEMTIAEAAEEMARRSIRRLLVAREAEGRRRLLGIVTSRDLARAFPPEVNPFAPGGAGRGPRRPVSEIMARDLKTAAPETPVEEAASLMRQHKIGALPVVRGDELVGIITESDIFRAFIEVIGGREPSVRVTFDLSEKEDIVGVVNQLARRHLMQLDCILSLEHDGRRLGVVRLSGPGAERFIDDVWKSGHRVLNILQRKGQPIPAGARR
ncbi:MAG: CBS domain-containing protein [Thermoanaerobaculia bacterium]